MNRTRGTGTNLKVGAPVQRESGGGGGTGPAQRRWKIFIGRAHSSFFGSKCTISGFVERFRDGQYSVASSLFAVQGASRPSFVKVGEGGTCPMESAPLNSTRQNMRYDMSCGAKWNLGLRRLMIF